MENSDRVQELKRAFIREYETLVPVVAGLTGSSGDDAREAFHNVFCRMLAGVTERPPGNPVVAWRPYIIQSVVNELKEKSRQVARRKQTIILFNELDTEGRQNAMSILDPQPNPAKQADRNELSTLAWKSLNDLLPNEREVIARRCLGASFREIALTLNISESRARGYYSEGLATLRRRFRVAA